MSPDIYTETVACISKPIHKIDELIKTKLKKNEVSKLKSQASDSRQADSSLH